MRPRPAWRIEEDRNMVSTKNRVDFYWDVVCPWCWITSRWLVDVARQKEINVNWKFFSLKMINKDRKMPEQYKIIHTIGLRGLRVAAAVRHHYGNDGVGKIYTVMGTRYHHDQEDIDEAADLKAILELCGFPSKLAAAADDEAWDQDIEDDMTLAAAKAGKDVGVPLIVLDNGKGPGFFGPVMSPAPTGKAAAAFWDAIVIAGRTPGFFELKRTRDTEPILGKRPKI